jgi:hypothetical protein
MGWYEDDLERRLRDGASGPELADHEEGDGQAVDGDGGGEGEQALAQALLPT